MKTASYAYKEKTEDKHPVRAWVAFIGVVCVLTSGIVLGWKMPERALPIAAAWLVVNAGVFMTMIIAYASPIPVKKRESFVKLKTTLLMINHGVLITLFTYVSYTGIRQIVATSLAGTLSTMVLMVHLGLTEHPAYSRIAVGIWQAVTGTLLLAFTSTWGAVLVLGGVFYTLAGFIDSNSERKNYDDYDLELILLILGYFVNLLVVSNYIMPRL